MPDFEHEAYCRKLFSVQIRNVLAYRGRDGNRVSGIVTIPIPLDIPAKQRLQSADLVSSKTDDFGFENQLGNLFPHGVAVCERCEHRLRFWLLWLLWERVGWLMLRLNGWPYPA